MEKGVRVQSKTPEFCPMFAQNGCSDVHGCVELPVHRPATLRAFELRAYPVSVSGDFTTSRAGLGRTVRVHPINGNPPILSFVGDLTVELTSGPTRKAATKPTTCSCLDGHTSEVFERERGMGSDGSSDEMLREFVKARCNAVAFSHSYLSQEIPTYSTVMGLLARQTPSNVEMPSLDHGNVRKPKSHQSNLRADRTSGCLE